MPKFMRARPPLDDGENRKIRKLAGARHAPADWSQRARIIALARSEPPGHLARDGAGELSAADEHGPVQWTLDTLARAARDAGITVGRSQVRRILLAEKVRWRRTRSRATSTDPEFAPKGPASRSCAPPRRKAPR